MTDKLRDPLLVVMNLPTYRETLDGVEEGPARYEGQELYLRRSKVLVALGAALAAAPQPAPADRETLVEVIDRALAENISPTGHNKRSPRDAIADALLARGLRLPGGDETMAWAEIGRDKKPKAETVVSKAPWTVKPGQEFARVAIRVVEGGDDAPADNS